MSARDADAPRPGLLAGPNGAVVAICAHLMLATFFLHVSEGWELLDCFYTAVVIATTVGYGDITPVRAISKLFLSAYAVLSVTLIGGVLQGLVVKFAEAQSSAASGAGGMLIRAQGGDGVASEGDVNDEDLVRRVQIGVERARARFKGTIGMLAVTCITGAIIYGLLLQGLSMVDTIYFTAITATTVGLGDIHPISRLGKAYAIVWLVLTSLGFANALAQYAELRLKERELMITRKLLSSAVSEQMFNEIDDDGSGTLSQAEYLGYVLCKLDKVSPDEVRLQHTLKDLHVSVISQY